MSTNYPFDTIIGLCESLKTAGFNENDINNLIKFNELKKVKDVVNRKAFVTYLHHTNTNDNPVVPFEEGHICEIYKNLKQGLIKLTPNDLGGIFLEEILRNENLDEKNLDIEKIFNNFQEKRFAGAIILDYLLNYPDIIPDSWKDKYIVFPGTIYIHSCGVAGDGLFVRYLYHCKGQKIWKCDYQPLERYLKYGLYENSFNAVLEQ